MLIHKKYGPRGSYLYYLLCIADNSLTMINTAKHFYILRIECSLNRQTAQLLLVESVGSAFNHFCNFSLYIPPHIFSLQLREAPRTTPKRETIQKIPVPFTESQICDSKCGV